MDVTLGAIEPDLRALAIQYACGVDRRDPDLYAGAFLDDGVLVIHRPGEEPEEGARRQGVENLRAVTESIKQYYKTMHFIGQSLFTMDGEVPTGETYCISPPHLRARRRMGRSDHAHPVPGPLRQTP